MSWLRLAVLAFLITILIFAGLARGQGRYDIPEQGPQPLQNGLPEQRPQPLQNDLPEQGPQLLQGDLPNHRQLSLSSGQSMDVCNPKAKLHQPGQGAKGINKSAKGASPKPYAFGPGSFEPASGHYGMQQAKEPQFGFPGKGSPGSSPGSTSFLDGYLLRSLQDDSLGKENRESEDKPTDDLPFNGETSSNF